jgi:hypothetical protein
MHYWKPANVKIRDVIKYFARFPKSSQLMLDLVTTVYFSRVL